MKFRTKQFESSREMTLFWTGLVMLCAWGATAEDDPEGWKGELAASVTAQSGSVDTFAGSIDAGAERKAKRDVFGLRFNGVYGTSSDRAGNNSKAETIQNAQGLFGSWRRTLRERYFWNTNSELSRDTTQDREVRARVVTGPGYRTWQGENADVEHFDVSAGMGYRYELYDGNVDDNPALRVDGNDQHLADAVIAFEYKNLLFDDKVEWTHTGSAAMPVNRTSAYIITTQAIAGIPLTASWSFRTGVFYEYVNDVPDDRNPSTLRVTLGLGYKF